MAASSHFSTTTKRALSRKGISVIGTQAIPDASGSFLNSTTGYVVSDNGTSRILSFSQVLEAAR